jgi:hypothetical protein
MSLIPTTARCGGGSEPLERNEVASEVKKSRADKDLRGSFLDFAAISADGLRSLSYRRRQARISLPRLWR